MVELSNKDITMKLLSVLLLFVPLIGISQDNGIEVRMNTGSSIFTDYVYIYSNNVGSFARINGRKGEKISINQIKDIKGIDLGGNERYFVPIEFGKFKRWGEQTFESERIKLYCTNSFDMSSPARAGDAYQKDDQEILSMKYKWLKDDLKDNEVSMDYLKKANNYRVAQLALWTAGIAFFVSGVVKLQNTPIEEDPSSLAVPSAFYFAAGVNLIAGFLERPKKAVFREALKKYN